VVPFRHSGSYDIHPAGSLAYFVLSGGKVFMHWSSLSCTWIVYDGPTARCHNVPRGQHAFGLERDSDHKRNDNILKGKCRTHTLEPAVAASPNPRDNVPRTSQPVLAVACAPAGDANSAGAGLMQLVEAADLIHRCARRYSCVSSHRLSCPPLLDSRTRTPAPSKRCCD
jgi:hypothetical protein